MIKFIKNKVNKLELSDFILGDTLPIRKQERNVNSIFRINDFKNCCKISSFSF